MKYRISKYNIFPLHLDDKNAPAYAIEFKKHWWSKWKSVYWNEDMTGNRFPKLFTKLVALEKFYQHTNTICFQCNYCYGRVGEAEFGYKRCKVRRTSDGRDEMVVMAHNIACAVFQKDMNYYDRRRADTIRHRAI